MSIYEFIGILRCPFIEKCGPGKGYVDDLDDPFEEVRTFKQCYTRRHFHCGGYLSQKSFEKARDSIPSESPSVI